jgi:predicted GIY-YIG superfamily endonuclease
MNISALSPSPTTHISFLRSQLRFVPERSGCYVLTTFAREVLYVGLATNLRQRCGQHLDSPAKRALSPRGRAVLFHWLSCEEINKVERTWLETHIRHEGVLPPLNRANSPVAI